VDLTQLWQEMCRLLSSGADVHTLLKQLVSAIGELFQVEGCVLLLPGVSTVYWDAHAPFALLQLGAIEVETELFPIGEEGIFMVCLEHSSVFASDDRHLHFLHPLWQVLDDRREPSSVRRTVLASTTQFHGVPNGMVCLLRSHPHNWSTVEWEGLQQVANQLAIVFSQVQLQQQLLRQQQYQAVVNQLTLQIHKSSAGDEILAQATADIARVLPVDRGLLLRLKYSEPLFRNRSQEAPKIRVMVASEWVHESLYETHPPARDTHSESAGASLKSPSPSAFWLSECALCQKALLPSTAPILLSGAQSLAELDLTAGIASLFNLEQLPSLLLSPLESRGTVLGFLVFQRRQVSTWHPDELELVKLVSAQVSTAIIQAETLRQVQSLVEKRTAELQQSLSIQAKLYERTRQQVDQLRHLNQMKDEFLSTVSHELRTPLTSMTMAIRMLQQVGLSSDRSARYLAILEQQCAQETHLINDLLALQELEATQVQIQREEINVQALLENLLSSWQQKWAAKELILDLKLPPEGLKLWSDRESLNRVLLELLTNAGKFSAPGSQVSLHISCQPFKVQEYFVMKLCNIGDGISQEELPHIFDKFRRSQGVTQNAIQGIGLGLALVKSLVQLLMGTIAVESKLLETDGIFETCFTLTLPRSISTE
jgi:signal transduction histidine kinase